MSMELLPLKQLWISKIYSLFSSQKIVRFKYFDEKLYSSRGELRHLSTILLKNFYLFKIVKSAINFWLKQLWVSKIYSLFSSQKIIRFKYFDKKLYSFLGELRYLSTILLKNFYFFKITKSIINFYFKK